MNQIKVALFATLATAQQTTTDVSIASDYVARVQNIPKDSDTVDIYKVEGNNKNKKTSYTVPADVQSWKIDDQICWVSQEPKKKAMPSLRACYTTTD